MKLYKLSSKEVVYKELIETKEVMLYPDKLTDDELIALGYKRVIEDDYPIVEDNFKMIKTQSKEEAKSYHIKHSLADVPLKMAKEIKLAELMRFIGESLNHSKTTAEGIGEVDAGNQYLINIDALIAIAEAGEAVDFKMYDNSVKRLNLEQLKKVKLAIAQKGIKLYKLKWLKSYEIEQAKSIKAIKDIKWIE